jgi:hypothetical protein
LEGHKNIKHAVYITVENALFTDVNDEFYIRTAKKLKRLAMVGEGFKYAT